MAQRWTLRNSYSSRAARARESASKEASKKQHRPLENQSTCSYHGSALRLLAVCVYDLSSQTTDDDFDHADARITPQVAHDTPHAYILHEMNLPR